MSSKPLSRGKNNKKQARHGKKGAPGGRGVVCTPGGNHSQMKAVALPSGSGFSPNWKAFLQTQKERDSKPFPNGVKSSKGRDILSGKGKSEHSGRKRKLKPEERKQSDHTMEQESGLDEIWFDDVDPELLKKSKGQHVEKGRPASHSNRKEKGEEKTMLLKQQESSTINNDGQRKTPPAPTDQNRLTKRLALDCEMVGGGIQGTDDILARVSLVNAQGAVVLDKYVKPSDLVTDYRTPVSGIREEDIRNGEDFTVVQAEVAALLQHRILVGHALHNDLRVLMLSHPRRDMRDTALYKPLRELAKTKRPSLKLLAKAVLGLDVQTGEHSSVEDARAAMSIYQRHKLRWESELKRKKTKPCELEDKPKGTDAALGLGLASEKSGRQRWLEKRRLKKERFKESRKHWEGRKRGRWPPR